MTADTAKGKREAIASEYILRILGLDVSTHVVILLSGLSSHFITTHMTSCMLLLVRSAMLDICCHLRARLMKCCFCIGNAEAS